MYLSHHVMPVITAGFRQAADHVPLCEGRMSTISDWRISLNACSVTLF